MAEARLHEIIPNFRRISGTKLFRSSRPDKLTNGSNISLFGKLDIRVILDMRSITELPKECLLDSYYQRETPVTSASTSEKEAKMDAGQQNNYLGKHHNFQLLDQEYKKCLMKRMPYIWQLLVAVLFFIDKLLGTIYAYKTIVSMVLNKEGCTQQYIDIISNSGKVIAKAIEPLSDKNNVPALICCAWGKDRTGIVCALIQDICGIDQEVIFSDYAKSEQELGTSGYDKHMRNELKGFGLHERYVEAKRDTMENVFAFIRTQHGSVNEYLELQGLTREKIAKIVENVKS